MAIFRIYDLICKYDLLFIFINKYILIDFLIFYPKWSSSQNKKLALIKCYQLWQFFYCIENKISRTSWLNERVIIIISPNGIAS